MPVVRFFREGIVCDAQAGETLRAVAARAGVEIYRSFHRLLNCRGRGRCGSCRIEVSDPAAVVPCERTAAERRHLDHGWSDATTRLACQISAAADLAVLTQEARAPRVEARSFVPRGY